MSKQTVIHLSARFIQDAKEPEGEDAYRENQKVDLTGGLSAEGGVVVLKSNALELTQGPKQSA